MPSSRPQCFYPRTPRGVRLKNSEWMAENDGFYPRTPRGVRQGTTSGNECYSCFYPRTPRGVRRFVYKVRICSCGFYPRTPRGVRHIYHLIYMLPAVSIHAPLVECDTDDTIVNVSYCGFYPRTPRGVRPGTATAYKVTATSFYPRTPRGVRHILDTHRSNNHVFLSTHPSWSATISHFYHLRTIQVSIHAPLVECDPHCKLTCLPIRVSIHAPLVECDQLGGLYSFQSFSFYPRTPRGVRHHRRRQIQMLLRFYPRTPRGVRRHGNSNFLREYRFLSTHPSWSATLQIS